MISKKIFVYNCYNLDGNNTTLNVIRGVWTERDVFLCTAEMVLGHLIPKVVLPYPTLPFLIKSSLRLINHCGRGFRDKSCREANKHLHPVSTAHQYQMPPTAWLHWPTSWRPHYSSRWLCCAFETFISFYKQIQGMEKSAMWSVVFQGSLKQLASESDENLHCLWN